MTPSNSSSVKHYDIAVYSILVLLVIIALILGLLVLKDNSPLQSLAINFATEIGGVVLIFLIVNKFFSLDSMGFSKLGDKIDSVANDITSLVKANNPEYLTKLDEETKSLRESVNHLTMEFGKLSERVMSEFSAQQKELMKSLLTQFQEQIDKSRNILEQAITKDIAPIIPSETAKIAVRDILFDRVMQVSNAMGQYQALAMEREFKNALNNANAKVNKSVQAVSKEVKDVKSKFDDLYLLLAAPEKEKSKS